MKVLCMICSGRGHLDMGGNGFTEYIKELHREHEVHILSTKVQCDFLANVSHTSHVFEYINQLMLPLEEHEMYQFEENFFMFQKMVELQIKSINPDLVLVDRILGLADPMLQSLGIKYISIGTNGAPWRKLGYVLDPHKPVHNKNGLTTKLQEYLKWPKNLLSAWSISSYLNICFVDSRFYPLSDQRVHYINMYSNDNLTFEGKDKFGISLGNGTYDVKEFSEKVNAILGLVPEDMEILIFGSQKDWEAISLEIKSPNTLKFLGYVDFKDYFKSLSHLIYAGGISTTWACIEYGVIPIIITGNTHDQDYNAETIKRELDLLITDIFDKQEEYQKKLSEFRNPSNFTHSLQESISIITSEVKPAS